MLSTPQGIEANKHFAALVQKSPEFELVTTPILGLTVFRLVLPSSAANQGLSAVNDLNRKLYARLMEHSDKLYLTQTMLNDVFCLRFAIGAQRTEIAHIDQAWELIEANGRAVLRELEGN